MENKRVEGAMRQAVHQRNYQRVRARALARLSRLYPDQYKELLEEEKKRDEMEGKRWTHLSDSPFFGVDYTPPHKRSPLATKAGKGGNQSDDGREA